MSERESKYVTQAHHCNVARYSNWNQKTSLFTDHRPHSRRARLGDVHKIFCPYFHTKIKIVIYFSELINKLFSINYWNCRIKLKYSLKFFKVLNTLPSGTILKVCRGSNFESWLNLCIHVKKQVFCFYAFVCAKEMLIHCNTFSIKIDCLLHSWVIFVWFLQRDEFAR